LRVYFATTVIGDRSRVAEARELVGALQGLGHEVLTAHLFDDGARASDGKLSPREIFERDLRWLRSADFVIVEASGSSFGIGFETGYTLGALEAPLWLLYHRPSAERISRMALGLEHEQATLLPYDSFDEVIVRLRDELSPEGRPAP